MGTLARKWLLTYTFLHICCADVGPVDKMLGIRHLIKQ